MPYLLGIDIGTSSVKAALVDADSGDLIATAGAEYPLHIPQPGYAEQNPDDWWTSTQNTVQRVLQGKDSKQVIGIGVSGQMHGVILLDSVGRVVHPAIIWADQRGAPACDTLLDAIGEARYIAITGTRPAAGFMATTLVWIKQHHPEWLEQAAFALLPKDYVRYCLTGTIGTDVSDAAGTGLFDIRKNQWSAEILAAVNLLERLFPEISKSYAVIGGLIASAAHALGLPEGVPVVAGCADQPAQAIGNGIVQAGTASITIGSGGQVFLPILPDASNVLKTDARLHIFNHAVPGWYALGAILSAGLSLRWLRDITGLKSDPNAYPILSAEADAVKAGAQGLIFLPYLSGERTPHFDPLARGGFIGLAAHHQRGHMARAVMEGVTFALKQALDLCESVSKPASEPSQTVIVSGGGAESAVWRQIIADILERPVIKSIQTEQATLGAAMLAGIGTGYFGGTLNDNIEAVRHRCARYTEPTQPDTQNFSIYRDRYAQFVGLYPALVKDFHRLAGGEDLNGL